MQQMANTRTLAAVFSGHVPHSLGDLNKYTADLKYFGFDFISSGRIIWNWKPVEVGSIFIELYLPQRPVSLEGRRLAYLPVWGL